MTRRVMGKLCRAPLEGQVIEAFAERLQQVDEHKRSEIAASIRNSQHRVLVETAFELADERRRRIEAMIHEHLTDGIDKQRLVGFLEAAADRSDRACATCRIRNLCAGGCYHESYAHFNDPLKPAYHYCDIMRDWVDFGVGVYSKIITSNPEFFSRHISPRRAVL